MTKQLRSLWFLSALALFLSVGISLSAQESTPSTAAPDTQATPAQAPAPDATPTQEGKPAQTPEAQPAPTPAQATPAQTPEAQPSQAPEASAPAKPDSTTPTAAQPNGVQSFTGTIVKSGDKYMFQDADSGNTYDIDHQSEVQKFEGKKVKVHGTLDASAKMIHVQ